jgi:hypothetical protein
MKNTKLFLTILAISAAGLGSAQGAAVEPPTADGFRTASQEDLHIAKCLLPLVAAPRSKHFEPQYSNPAIKNQLIWLFYMWKTTDEAIFKQIGRFLNFGGPDTKEHWYNRMPIPLIPNRSEFSIERQALQILPDSEKALETAISKVNQQQVSYSILMVADYYGQTKLSEDGGKFSGDLTQWLFFEKPDEVNCLYEFIWCPQCGKPAQHGSHYANKSNPQRNMMLVCPCCKRFFGRPVGFVLDPLTRQFVRRCNLYPKSAAAPERPEAKKGFMGRLARCFSCGPSLSDEEIAAARATARQDNR